MRLEMTKQEVANLSKEEQEAVAKVALTQLQFERKMLHRAKDRGSFFVSFLLVFLILAAAAEVAVNGDNHMRDLAILVPFMFVATVTLILIKIKDINNRIDAVLRLMELEKEDADRLQTPPSLKKEDTDQDWKPLN